MIQIIQIEGCFARYRRKRAHASHIFRDSHSSILRFWLYLSPCFYRTTCNRIVACIACDRNKFLFLFYIFISTRSRIFVIVIVLFVGPHCITFKPAVGLRAPSVDGSIRPSALSPRNSKRVEFFFVLSRHLAIRSPLAINASLSIMAWIFPKVNRSCGYLIRKEDRNMRLCKNWKDTTLSARAVDFSQKYKALNLFM